MNIAIVGLGIAMLCVFPKLKGKVGKQGLFVSGPIGFIVIMFGIIMA